MSSTGSYDRRAPLASSQIITLERLLEEANDYNELLEAKLERLTKAVEQYTDYWEMHQPCQNLIMALKENSK